MASANGAALRVMVADDSDAVRRSLAELLNARPSDWFLCGESRDGFETLRKAGELRPDVILLDLSIPLLSGIEAAKALKRENCPSSLVLMSAQEPEVLRRIAAGVHVPFSISKTMLADGLAPILETIGALKRGSRLPLQ